MSNYKKDQIRIVNAVLALVLVIGLFVHAFLGALGMKLSWRGSFEFIVWGLVAVIAVHIICSMITTIRMFSDKERPASTKKKLHQCLKWLTGIIFGAFLYAHIICMPLDVFNIVKENLAIAVVLLIALGWHAIVGIKSFTRDLNISKDYRIPVKISIAVVTICLVLCIGFLVR